MRPSVLHCKMILKTIIKKGIFSDAFLIDEDPCVITLKEGISSCHCILNGFLQLIEHERFLNKSAYTFVDDLLCFTCKGIT